jgi:4'-phosphopantetheinyl transferase
MSPLASTPQPQASANQATTKLAATEAANHPLRPGQVDLWFCFDAQVDEHWLPIYRDQLLNDSERARELRFHFARDRRQFVITRALVRSVLSRYADVPACDWQFEPGSHGRPRVVQPQAAHLSFNLSHTSGLILLAVAARMPLGVDTENTRQREAPLEIVDHFFSPPEAQALAALPAALQPARFFQYWTLKEAYIKAKEQGLSIPLAKFGMQLDTPDQIAPWFSPEIEPNPQHWQFYLLQAGPEHVAALCAQNATPITLQMNKICPLQTPQNFDAIVLRQTPIQANP